MEMCAEDTLGQTWDCLRESNGEFLPFILMVECFLWIFVIAGGTSESKSSRNGAIKRRWKSA